MKKPRLQDDALLADIHAARRLPATDPRSARLTLWWLGQSGFLLVWRGHTLLLDPYLSDSLTRKYAATDKPHVRLSELVVDPARLDHVAAVTSSHNHTDHLDPETLGPLVRTNPEIRMVCPEANRVTVRERSGLPDDRILGLDPDSPGATEASRSVAIEGTPFRLHAVPAAHETLDRDTAGRLIYLGFVVEAGPFRIYHSGDTVLFPGLAEILQPYRIDLALLPINGRAPERRVAGNLWGTEAAQLARDIDARCVVPCHYDLFAFNTATPDAFVAECLRLGQTHQVLEQGGRLDLDPPPAR